MGNINKHTGSNIGGLNPVQWVYQKDIESMSFSPATLIASISLKSGKDWNDIYATPGTISMESTPNDGEFGMVHSYTISMEIPKTRIDAEQELAKMDNRKLIVKVKDKNGIVHLYGTTDAAFIKTHKATIPEDVQGFNGYLLIFTGDLPHPALFIPSEDGIQGL